MAGHNKLKCPTMTSGEPLASDNPAASAASLGQGGAKRKAEEALLSSNLVEAQRLRVDDDDIFDSAIFDAALAKPLNVFENFKTNPGGSPIPTMTKQVIPYVEYMLFQMLKRCVFFFH